jgi:hypothetical protein
MYFPQQIKQITGNIKRAKDWDLVEIERDKRCFFTNADGGKRCNNLCSRWALD